VIHTRFTEAFGIEAPIMSAPMAVVSGASLAGAVSAAGALGTFGGTNTVRGPQWLRDEVAAIRSQTDRPFGVGFITHFLTFTEELFGAALEARPPVIVLSFAPTGRWMGRAHEAGARVICQVQTMDLVRDALDEGADALLVQGHEAGGHTGTMGLLPFLAGALEVSGDTPVLAAGGVSSGRALAAVLAAGADGASLGTAFLASREAIDVPDAYKECIVQSNGEDTVFTTLYDDVHNVEWPKPVGMRLRRTKHTDQWLGREDEVKGRLEHLRAELPGVLDFERFDPELSTILYGQSAASVNAVRPVAAIVRDICREAESLLRQRTPSLIDPPPDRAT
jgi:nitronate monooxygenase